MDEGFTQYASEHITEYLKSKALIPGDPDPNPFAQFYEGYAWLVEKNIEEPMGTHADFFNYNGAYSQAAYNKGAVFLHQLQYVIGKPAFDRGMLAFFEKWKFRHPDDVDFMRVMEDVSGLELDWYLELMTSTIKQVDYAVDSVFGDDVHTTIRLRRDGDFPMPLDVAVDLADGRTRWYTIPLDIMRGYKAEPAPDGHPPHVLPDWMWVNPGYVMVIDAPVSEIRSVRIDPSTRLADLWTEENSWPVTVKETKE
jgi:aminopeptidase N